MDLCHYCRKPSKTREVKRRFMQPVAPIDAMPFADQSEAATALASEFFPNWSKS